MSKAKYHFWHGLFMPTSYFFEPRNEAMPYWLTHSVKAITTKGWHLHEKPSYTTAEVQILGQIHMPWPVLPIPSLHAWFMHACHTHDRGTKQTRQRWGPVMGMLLQHTPRRRHLSQAISPCPWLRNSQTLGRSMSSSGECSCIKKHKYPDLIFTNASCC